MRWLKRNAFGLANSPESLSIQRGVSTVHNLATGSTAVRLKMPNVDWVHSEMFGVGLKQGLMML